MSPEDELKVHQVKNIRQWDNKQLIQELRNPMRASIGERAYTLIFAETLARLLEKRK